MSSLSLINMIATTTDSLHLAGLSSAFFYSRKWFKNCLFAYLTQKLFSLFIQLYHLLQILVLQYENS